MTEEIRYIQVDETHKIEVMPSGNFYPQQLVNPQWKEHYEGWGYYKTGNQQKHFKTEVGAHKFLAEQANAAVMNPRRLPATTKRGYRG